jgi:four helix bundle protein
MSGARGSGRLIVWQLSDQLRLEVFRLTRGQGLEPDHKLRSQIDDAAGEVCRNIEEALGTDRDREFARFIRLARAAIHDIQNGLRVALTKRYVAEADVREVRELLSRLYPALSSLLAHSKVPLHQPLSLIAPTSD